MCNIGLITRSSSILAQHYGIERDALPKPSNYFPTLGVRTIEKSQNHGVLESKLRDQHMFKWNDL